MVGVWLKNLAKFATGTNPSGSIQALDVVVQNSSSIPVTFSSGSIKETRFHDMSTTNFNAAGGTWVQIGGAAAVANTITNVKVASTGGQPMGIRKAASAGAAAALSDDSFTINAGEGETFLLALVAGDKLWALSKTSTVVDSGFLILNLIG